MTEDKKKEYTARIKDANKTQMIVVVYDIALSYIEEALVNLQEEKIKDYKEAVSKSGKCIRDLIDSLNFDYEISYSLLSLYTYVNRKLILAEMKKEKSYLLDSRDVLLGLKESFETIAKQDKSTPMMENTQHVMAGMTYGKGVLNESIANPDMVRTFSV